MTCPFNRYTIPLFNDSYSVTAFWSLTPSILKSRTILHDTIKEESSTSIRLLDLYWFIYCKISFIYSTSALPACRTVSIIVLLDIEDVVEMSRFSHRTPGLSIFLRRMHLSNCLLASISCSHLSRPGRKKCRRDHLRGANMFVNLV